MWRTKRVRIYSQNEIECLFRRRRAFPETDEQKPKHLKYSNSTSRLYTRNTTYIESAVRAAAHTPATQSFDTCIGCETRTKKKQNASNRTTNLQMDGRNGTQTSLWLWLSVCVRILGRPLESLGSVANETSQQHSPYTQVKNTFRPNCMRDGMRHRHKRRSARSANEWVSGCLHTIAGSFSHMRTQIGRSECVFASGAACRTTLAVDVCVRVWGGLSQFQFQSICLSCKTTVVDNVHVKVLVVFVDDFLFHAVVERKKKKRKKQSHFKYYYYFSL